MIKFVRAEKESELNFTGVEITDLSDKSINFKTSGNEFFRVEYDGYSSLRIMVPERAKLVKRYIIEGEYKGLKFDEKFEDEYSAKCRINELDSELRNNFCVKSVEVLDK